MSRYKKKGVNKLTIVGFAIGITILVLISFYLFSPSKIQMTQEEFDFLSFHLNSCNDLSKENIFECTAKRTNDITACKNLNNELLIPLCESNVKLYFAITQMDENLCPEGELNSLCLSLMSLDKNNCENNESIICDFYNNLNIESIQSKKPCEELVRTDFTSCLSDFNNRAKLNPKINDFIYDCKDSPDSELKNCISDKLQSTALIIDSKEGNK